MHDKLQTGVGRGIDNRLTLMYHLYRIPGCQEEAVDPRQGFSLKSSKQSVLY
jgi:hypothetical protein